MNKHIFTDRLTARVGSGIAGKKKFFSQSIKSESFESLVNAVSVPEIEISGEGTFDLTTETTGGSLEVAYRVEKWLGDDYPTLIYHHGNNERPFDYRKGAKNTFLNIFVRGRDAFKINLIVVRAPFHDLSLKEYQEKMTDLKNFMNMIAASVKVNEALIRALQGDQPVLTSGISLGGWVTNLHRSIYNTSAIYIPLLAGSFLGELFLCSKYKRLAGQLALQQPDQVRELLNFDKTFNKVSEMNVFPLLARYDQYIEYEVQRESYVGMAVKTIEAGHVTAAVSASELRAHILQILEKTGICID